MVECSFTNSVVLGSNLVAVVKHLILKSMERIAKKWTQRWFELQFQSAKSYFFVFCLKWLF